MTRRDLRLQARGALLALTALLAWSSDTTTLARIVAGGVLLFIVALATDPPDPTDHDADFARRHPARRTRP